MDADEILAESLKTGDVVAFSRDPTAYYVCVKHSLWQEVSLCLQPIGSIVSALIKSKTGTQYDHFGVIVFIAGMPHVLERTFSGIKV